MLSYPNKLSKEFASVYANCDAYSAADPQVLLRDGGTLSCSQICTRKGREGSSVAIEIWQTKMYRKRNRKSVHRVPLEQDIAKGLTVVCIDIHQFQPGLSVSILLHC